MARNRRFGRRCCCLLALAMTGWLSLTPFAAAESYTFAVVPHFEGRRLFAIWKPIVDELEKRTGLSLSLVAMLSLPEFEREFLRGGFDFAFTSTYLALPESNRQGYIPLVRDDIPLRGILVVARDAPFRSVTELEGKTLAVPSPNAMAASLMLRADLDRLFHINMRILNVKTHTSVYLHVVNGLADAGGGAERTLKEQNEPIRKALRILHTTDAVPSHPVTVHPRVPEAVREQVRRAFLDLGGTVEGREMLAKVPMTRPVAASADDYRQIRDLGLERFWIPDEE